MKIKNAANFNIYYNSGGSVIEPDEVLELEDGFAKSLLAGNAGNLVPVPEDTQVTKKVEKGVADETPEEIPTTAPAVEAPVEEFPPAVEPKKGKK